MLALGVVVLMATACGGNGGDATPVPTTPPPSPTLGTVAPSDTPLPPTPMPPTWTPRPVRTEPPRATIVYTYQPPEQPTFFVPTYTPTPVPPSSTPTGPTLWITASLLNEQLNTTLAAGSGGLFLAPPTISFQSDIMLVLLDVLTTPGDTATARPLQIQTAVSVDDAGRLTLTALQASFTDNNAIYENDELIANLLGTLDDILDAVTVQVYRTNEPVSQRFYVRAAWVFEDGIRVETVRED